MNQLTLSFLGSFEARLGEQLLSNFRSAKVQGLLIYLALTRQQAHERDVLAALFWPDEPETVANHNLRQSLYRLRQLLGEPTDQGEPLQQAQGRPYLLVTRTTVHFNAASNYTLDVAAFLSHLQAISSGKQLRCIEANSCLASAVTACHSTSGCVRNGNGCIAWPWRPSLN